MTFLEGLSAFGDVATILTAVVAVAVSGRFYWNARDRRIRLEKYLARSIRSGRPALYRKHSLIHLAAELGMTEAELSHAGFTSKVIERSVGWDPVTLLATEVLFSRSGAPPPTRDVVPTGSDVF